MSVKCNKPLSAAMLNLALLFTVGAACLIPGASSTAYAQQAAGAITGTVTDQTGAPIANAVVTVRDTGSRNHLDRQDQQRRHLRISADSSRQRRDHGGGDWFRHDDPQRLHAGAEPGGAGGLFAEGRQGQHDVEVVDAPPLLQTASTEIGTLIDSNAATSLPLATRDINQLTLLAPGVVSPNIFAFESSQTTFGTGRPYVNGAREQDNNFSLDGMDVNQPDNNDVAYVPSVDAVQEFNIITSNAPADFGNYIGGVMVESLKSGTNQFHGDVYEYIRNTDLDANTWQNKANAFVIGSDRNRKRIHPAPLRAAMERVWRHRWRSDHQEQAVLLRRLAGHDQQHPGDTADQHRHSIGISHRQLREPLHQPGSYVRQRRLHEPGSSALRAVCEHGSGQPYSLPEQQGAGQQRGGLGHCGFSAASQQQEQQQNYATSGYVHSYQGDAKIDWQASPEGSRYGPLLPDVHPQRRAATEPTC